MNPGSLRAYYLTASNLKPLNDLPDQGVVLDREVFVLKDSFDARVESALELRPSLVSVSEPRRELHFMLKHRHQLEGQIDQPRIGDDTSLCQVTQEMEDQTLIGRRHQCLLMASTQPKEDIALICLGQSDAEIELEELQYPVCQVGIGLA